MDDVQTLRALIDAVDDQIIAALNERFLLQHRMRELKRRENLPPVDAARERFIYEKALAATPSAERDTIYGIYERIFGGSRGVIETIARGVAVKDGKVLLCRAKGSASTYLPGGHVEFGETGAVALVREVKEELGVDAKAGEMLGVVENSFDQHGKRHAEINLVYRLEIEGMPTISCENWIEFEWCSLADLPAAKLLPTAIADFCR